MSNNDRRRDAISKELDDCLERVETTPDGRRIWRELYYAQPLGHRALTMSLSVPPAQEAPPVVVYIHGGGWMFGHHNVQHPNLVQMRLFDSLAAAGYAVARISYRLSSEGHFPTQLHDCKAAIRYLRHYARLFGINPDRIAALGESAGGHLALLLGLETPPAFEGEVGITGASSSVQAVVDWYGVTNLLTIDSQALPDSRVTHGSAESSAGRLIGGAITDRMDAACAASPITWVSEGAAPCLVQHGTADAVVPPDQAREICNALTAAGVRAELELIDGADHCFLGVDTAAIVPRVIGFLDSALKDRSS
ncbi:alpha/beta hydrolase [Pelagibacterium limicola]|uniref:alpha/beta hydrolase n=1 Tax=Pelagibacterium limicola TaxID=2791022 RepID=UPI0018AFD002|nr:alpha/beta hydrolase [Pelagibacterium limicola]